jgi:hypothetical protein
MTFEDAVAVLRSWIGEPVTVVLVPDDTMMRGPLSELDSEGTDGALFAVDAEHTSGVAIALFRDGVHAASLEDGELVVEQGRMTVRVSRGA